MQELEGKHSDLRRELVMVKEALSQITLQKEVLEDDKASLTLALSKVNSSAPQRTFCKVSLRSVIILLILFESLHRLSLRVLRRNWPSTNSRIRRLR